MPCLGAACMQGQLTHLALENRPAVLDKDAKPATPGSLLALFSAFCTLALASSAWAFVVQPVSAFFPLLGSETGCHAANLGFVVHPNVPCLCP